MPGGVPRGVRGEMRARNLHICTFVHTPPPTTPGGGGPPRDIMGGEEEDVAPRRTNPPTHRRDSREGMRVRDTGVLPRTILPPSPWATASPLRLTLIRKISR
jgi:hypothetical protein